MIDVKEKVSPDFQGQRDDVIAAAAAPRPGNRRGDGLPPLRFHEIYTPTRLHPDVVWRNA